MPMLYLIFKIAVSAALIALISEISRRYSFVASVLASLPLLSILSFIWIYLEQGDASKIAAMSQDIFWLVLPSLLLFLILPLLIKLGWGFWQALSVSGAATVFAYLGTIYLMKLRSA